MGKRDKDRYKKIFKHDGIKKVIPYRSVKDCKVFKLERINPDHVGIIWGKPKGSHNFIKVAKVYFCDLVAMVSVAYGLSVSAWIGIYTDSLFKVLGELSLWTMFISFIVGCLVHLPIIMRFFKWDLRKLSVS